MEESWARSRPGSRRFAWAGIDAIEAEELAVLPGLDEIFALADIKAHAKSGDWDVLVVDCAHRRDDPAAQPARRPQLVHAAALLGRPAANKLVSPVLGRLPNLPMAGDEAFGATDRFYDRLDGVKELLTDQETTSVRLVVNPERMVIAEARRTYSYLSLFGYRVDCVVANRLLPDDIQDRGSDRWRALHAEHLTAIEEGFAPLPVLKAQLANDELIGPRGPARAFAAGLYGEEDPAARRQGELLRAIPPRDGPVLVLDLPIHRCDELDLGRSGEELLGLGRPLLAGPSCCSRLRFEAALRHRAHAQGRHAPAAFSRGWTNRPTALPKGWPTSSPPLGSSSRRPGRMLDVAEELVDDPDGQDGGRCRRRHRRRRPGRPQRRHAEPWRRRQGRRRRAHHHRVGSTSAMSTTPGTACSGT